MVLPVSWGKKGLMGVRSLEIFFFVLVEKLVLVVRRGVRSRSMTLWSSLIEMGGTERAVHIEIENPSQVESLKFLSSAIDASENREGDHISALRSILTASVS